MTNESEFDVDVTYLDGLTLKNILEMKHYETFCHRNFNKYSLEKHSRLTFFG